MQRKPALGSQGWANRLAALTPQMVLLPTLIAALVYVVIFSLWTLWISVSQSTLLPNMAYGGFGEYASLWKSKRWIVSYQNLFLFGALYVSGSIFFGTLLAILIDQRVRYESVWRTIFLYPLAVSFIVTGTVWRWIFHPQTGVELALQDLGWIAAKFDWITDRDMAIYVVVFTGIWHASGFAMALILAGLRSVDGDLVKAAQIDGASMPRIYRKVVLPTIWPIFVAVTVVLLQFAIKTYDLVVALTQGGPGVSTTVPAIVVYDLMFQRGQIAQGAAAAVMILVALALVLVPYALWSGWRARKEARSHG
ncbi:MULTISPECIES: carbohydrate ABC transporter permease [Halocynthiibacter]|uniref:Sugar ABC transporter permease n=1 Tax=Halocynthiibacter halioticoli TaxID=2986804 RepID=A0AAE3LRW7_9RHOB|nr:MULTISPECIES: sugar ABC transporter permease [Halocynthiibacter]MCV6825073.1 sugar ABC transporter permease [Halocynthiibacter halioticoli]MCW4058074.1 sugar ABC transporter permease [Halocynthiibacter sp. SDUM655004]MDE0588893.1 sugar ABC transporter permease [Halocynthiibacter sp. C4]